MLPLIFSTRMEESNLKELLDREVVRIASSPAKNDFPIDRIDRLDGYTVPLISHDYAASTPIMWNTLYEKLRLNIRNIMVVASKENLERIFNAFRRDPKYLGGGAGTGLKEASIKYLDEVRPADLKSVNIIVKENGRLIGYNTDTYGFARSLEEKFKETGSEIKGKNLVVFGAGGVAKEVVYMLAEKGAARIHLINRTFSKAVDIAADLNKKYGDLAQGNSTDMTRGIVLNSQSKPHALINLSEVGQDGELADYSFLAPINEFNETLSRQIIEMLRGINPEIIIADIVSQKRKTKTLRMAEAYGLKNLLDGIPMVIYQAVPAFDLVAKAYPHLHPNLPSLEEILKIFKEAALR